MKDYIAGRGRAMVAKLTNGVPGAFVALSNLESFSFGLTTEKGEHYESETINSLLDASWINKKGGTIEAEMSDINKANAKLMFSARVTEVAASTTTAEVIAADLPAVGDILTLRRGLATSVVIKDSTASPKTLAAGVNYNLRDGDAFGSLDVINVTTGGPFVAPIMADYSYGAQSRATIREYKDKYEYINSHEVKWYKWSFYCFGVGIGLLINLYGSGERVLNEVGVWFFVRIFFGFAGATLVGYVAKLTLQYYYPTKLNAKLKKWRYIPRVNTKTGNRMRVLPEEEEDVHLDEGSKSEENIFSIDYDVWIDDKSGDIHIEKYQGHLTAFRCNNCGFFTMKVTEEEVSERFEDGSPKEIIKHYRCEYCKNVRATAFPISRKEGEDFKQYRDSNKRNTRNIDAVKIEIHSVLSGKRFYEFNSLEQAQKFLEEFDKDKAAKS